MATSSSRYWTEQITDFHNYQYPRFPGRSDPMTGSVHHTFYQYYIRARFINHRTGKGAREEGFSRTRSAVNATVLIRMRDEAIGDALHRLESESMAGPAFDYEYIRENTDWEMTRIEVSKMLVSRWGSRKKKLRSYKELKAAQLPKGQKKMAPEKKEKPKKKVENDWVRLPGSAKHYRNRATGEEVTYRVYLKKVGRTPKPVTKK